MSFVSELKRRNVFRVAAGYAVASWVLVQVATTVLPQFHAPEAIGRWIIIALALGFLPALAFGWMYELTPHGLKTQAQADAAGLASNYSGARGNLLLVVLLVLGLGLFALGRYSAAPSPDAGGEAGEPSIAVLPFVNMSADPANTYFSDGLSETLLDMLAQVPALKVSARTSSFAFRDKAEDVRTIGAALGVAHLLEGSVQKAGDQVRITAQLVRTSDGVHVWSRRFDRQLTDVFKIQDEIATEVVAALEMRLVAGAEQRLTQKRTENVEAYQEYLKGLALLPDRKVSDLHEAARHFERAIELDPGFARAYVGASDAYALLSEYAVVTDEETQRRRAYVERALALAPELGEAHASRAIALSAESDFAGAELEFKRAIELAPSYPTAYQWYGELLRGPLSRPEEGLAMSEHAASLDPLSPILALNLADAQAGAGRSEEARATLERLTAQHPEYASAYLRQAAYAIDAGDLVGALRAMNAHDRADPDAVGYASKRCEILATFGALEPWRACVARIARRAPDQPGVVLAQSNVALERGDVAGALALLERMRDKIPVDYAVMLLRAGRAADALAQLRPLFPELVDAAEPRVPPRQRPLAIAVGVVELRAKGHEARGRALLEAVLAQPDPEREATSRRIAWRDVACLHALGRHGDAMKLLEREVAAGNFVELALLDIEPLASPIREDPDFERIVAPARARVAEQIALARAAGLL